MKKVITAILMALVVNNASAYTGNDWIDGAKAYIDDRTDTPTDAYQNGYFIGIVTGLQQGFNQSSYPYAICYPKDSTAGQWAEIAAQYLIDHPEERHKHLALLVWASHLYAFDLQSEESCHSHADWKKAQK